MSMAGVGPALDDSFGFLVCDTARHVKRVLASRLAQYGIPGSCWFVLRALWLQDGISQRELSECLGLAEPPLLATLRTMERLDLVTRERDVVDRRRMRVLLTPRARGLEPELLALAQELNRELMVAIPQAEQAGIVSTLRQIRATAVKQQAGTTLPLDEDPEMGLPMAGQEARQG